MAQNSLYKFNSPVQSYLKNKILTKQGVESGFTPDDFMLGLLSSVFLLLV